MTKEEGLRERPKVLWEPTWSGIGGSWEGIQVDMVYARPEGRGEKRREEERRQNGFQQIRELSSIRPFYSGKTEAPRV